ncbi:hypothetical protein NKG94_32730 [Micromonospora sp. M12]
MSGTEPGHRLGLWIGTVAGGVLLVAGVVALLWRQARRRRLVRAQTTP